MTPEWSDNVLQDDISLLSTPDVNRPFSDREDVFNRLIPYHVFAEVEDAEAQDKPKCDLKAAEDLLRQVKEKISQTEAQLKLEGRRDRLRTLSEEGYLRSLCIGQEKARALAASTPQAQQPAANTAPRPAPSAARPQASVQPRPLVPQQGWFPVQQQAGMRPQAPAGPWYPIAPVTSQQATSTPASRPATPMGQPQAAWATMRPLAPSTQPGPPLSAPGALSYFASAPMQLVGTQRAQQVVQSPVVSSSAQGTWTELKPTIQAPLPVSTAVKSEPGSRAPENTGQRTQEPKPAQ